jgi:hypothetical protein
MRLEKIILFRKSQRALIFLSTEIGCQSLIVVCSRFLLRCEKKKKKNRGGKGINIIKKIGAQRKRKERRLRELEQLQPQNQTKM